VLGLVVTTHLYQRFPDLPEGELAKVRASVVSAATMAEVASEVGLGAGLRLGKGEDASGGRDKPSILADAMEAVFGAVYLGLGWTPAQDLVVRLLAERMEEAAEGPGGHDFKTQLQELAARRFDELPRYRLREEGPDHAKTFHAVVEVGGIRRGVGQGRSKKQAEQDAAKQAWRNLTADGGGVDGGTEGDPAGERGDAPVSVSGGARESEGHDA
jgi:ribonuclease-3